MDYESIRQLVTTEIADRLGIKEEEVDLEADLNTQLHLDSVDRMELIMRLEETVDIHIREEDLDRVTSARKLVDLAYSLVNG